jgi:hypothetical protein
VWLTQRQMSELFESSTDNIGLHLKNIFADSELRESATTEDFSVVQSEGGRRVHRRVKHYNLDAIISVGYRVNSHRGIRLRQWATSTLRELLAVAERRWMRFDTAERYSAFCTCSRICSMTTFMSTAVRVVSKS